MTQQARRTRFTALTRKALMMSCASAALATAALMPQAAKAQAFQGSITGSTGSVTRTPTTGTTETIGIGSNNATINWSPTHQQQGGGTIDFLPNGNTATFTSTGGLNHYTVLNRILPATGQAIGLNGRVISTLQETSAPGGRIWFYAPGGIVVGATAVFNVGSLLLTTNDVTSFGTTANGFNATFNGAAGSTSKIQIMNGAQINALQQNSYVALVAPRIEQGGKVRVNGTAAYAAGEQLSMTMNQGLFDIQVNVGTGDGNGIVHTGETSGPANQSLADNHKIYMVAVPKNQALTMLLGGTVGFDDAVSANVRNGQIFLSSGWGVHDSDGSGQSAGSAGLNSNIAIGSGTYTSDVKANGQGFLRAAADSGDATFAGDLALNSSRTTDGNGVALSASHGHQLTVAGNLNLLSSTPADSFAAASILADSGGSVTIGGSATLSATNGTDGGNASMIADGGTISIAGATHLYAAGVSSPPGTSGTTGTDSTGGTIMVQASNQGAITTGALLLDAFGTGQANLNGGAAGSGYGGSIWLGADSSGSITVNGSLTANASGTGGNASSGSGGFASGGSVDVETTEGGSLAGGDLTANANATGGDGSIAGGAAGGEINLLADSWDSGNATGMSLGNVNLSTNGIVGTGGPGGETSGVGGDITIQGTGGSISANQLNMRASGTNFGGAIDLETNVGSDDLQGSLHFGGVDAMANGQDFGGSIFVASGSGSTIDLGTAALSAFGGFGGSISLLAGSGGEGESAAQSPALPAGGGIAATDLTLNTTGNIYMGLSGGADISVSGTLTGNAGQFISIFDDGSGGAIRAHEIDLFAITIDDNADILADIINFTSAGTMTLANLTATNSMDLTAGSDLITGDLTSADMNLNAGGNITFGNITADRLDFEADYGSVTGGDIQASTRVGGTADGAILLGNITAGPNMPPSGEFSVGIASNTSITVGNVTGAGHVGFATLGDFTAGNLTAGDLVMLLVGGDIDTGSITTAATGRVYLADASMFLTGGGEDDFDPNIVLALAPVPTGGSITIGGPVTTGRLDAAAGNDFSLDDVTAQTSVALTAGGLATFNGIVKSPTITVTSSDIDIAEGASLGVWGTTNLITLNAVSHGLPILIGNTTAAPGQYHLDEDGDIRSAALVINAQGATPGANPDVKVFDVNIPGSATPGGGIGNITLNTGGSVFFQGNVHFASVGATDRLTINAGHAIELNTDTGSIVLTDRSGKLSGTLGLNAANIWVGAQSLLTQLEANPNFAGRDAALGTNSGTANQNGFLRAGAITAGVANSFFVQNSGTPTLFAGIDTGDGGLSVANTGTTPATVVIYGRETQSTGTIITNQDFLASVALAGTSGFTTDSAVNGCAIGGTCKQPMTPGSDSSSILGPLGDSSSDDDKKKDKNSDESDDGSSVDPSLRLINTTPVNLNRPIDTPVTSGGDVVIGGAAVQPN